jgi:hypothetical protein
MLVPRVHLEEHIGLLHTHVAGKCGELVFNLDELGSSDWEVRRIRKVIAPSIVRKEDVYHSVSRRHRHVTLLTCLSAAGDSLTPMIITGSAIRPSLWSRGLRQDEDVAIRIRTAASLDGWDWRTNQQCSSWTRPFVMSRAVSEGYWGRMT